MITRRLLSFWSAVGLSALLAVSAPVAVLSQGTSTPMPTVSPVATGTAVPSLTPFVPDFGQCAPTSMIPTVEPFATPTPCPDGSCPTATVTPPVTETPQANTITCVSSNCVQVNSYTVALYDYSQAYATNSENRAFIRYSVSPGVPYVYYRLEGLSADHQHTGTGTQYAYLEYHYLLVPDNPSPGVFDYEVLGDGGVATLSLPDVLLGYVPDQAGASYELGLFAYADRSTYTGTFHISLIWVSTSAAYSTPVPTPDCGDYTDDGDVDPDDELIAYFNPPSIVSQGCYGVLSPVTIGFPDATWLPLELPDGVSIPGWQICVQLVTMSAVFAGVDWVAVLASVVTFIAIGGIYKVLANQ